MFRADGAFYPTLLVITLQPLLVGGHVFPEAAPEQIAGVRKRFFSGAKPKEAAPFCAIHRATGQSPTPFIPG
ncbi:MAG TPA: hypothetical protein VF916_12485 [Ktedonobacterales bacterium]